MKKLLAICLIAVLFVSCLPFAVWADEAALGNTYNGEAIPFADWTNISMEGGAWTEENGIITANGGCEWLLLQYNRKIEGNYIIEFDVKQPDKNKNLQIIMGFECEKGENYTTTGLTLELHNAGVGRLYDTAINRKNQGAYGGCNNPYGGGQGYGATTEWIHVKIQRVENLFIVEYNDGVLYQITATLEDYNGGYLVLGAQNARQISYKNITIQDNMDVQMSVDEPEYPEDPGTRTYHYNGNKYGEWLTDGDTWTVDGAYLTQTAEPEEEKVAWLDTDKLRNFRLSLDYEVLSGTEGYFGIGFRKGAGAKPYQETLGYALLFKCTPDGNTMTVIDYLEAGDSGMDGLGHAFELAGHVEISCSGNEICVWLDNELIVNVKNNSYASGVIALFAKGCSVEFSDMEVISDALVSTASAGIVESAGKLTDSDKDKAANALQKYEALNAFQKSMFPEEVKAKLESIANAGSNAGAPAAGDQTVIWIIVGVAVVVAAAVVVILIVRKKNKK